MARTDLEVHVHPPKELLWAFLLIGFALLLIGYSFLNNVPKRPSLIFISASGSVSENPSQAVISLFLNATGNTASIAVSNLSVNTNYLNSTVLSLVGNNASLIQTTSYNVYVPPRCTNSTYYYYPNRNCIPASAPIYYVATESIQITLPKVSDVGRAITLLTSIAGLSINNVAAKLSPQQQQNMSQQALSLALSNATSQAQLLSSGRKVIVQNITVLGNNIYYPYNLYGNLYSLGVFSSGSVLSGPNQTFFAGRATITKSISIVFSAT